MAAARTIGATTAPVACAAETDSKDPHRRQYCDKRKRRFYYFDPEHKQYFWENGKVKN